MRFEVRFTEGAEQDIERLYDGRLQRAEGDVAVAQRALRAIRDGVAILERAPLSCRKADADTPFLRELVIGVGASGYVLLFEVENSRTVTVLAVRHQREDDYH